MQYAIHTVYKCVLLGDKILVGCNISCEIIHLQQTIPMNEMQQRKQNLDICKNCACFQNITFTNAGGW